MTSATLENGKKVIWQGTVDNRNLAGIRNGDAHPMRVVEDADGRLMTEFADNTFADESEMEVVYGDGWYADYQGNFRDADPQFPADLVARMVEQGLLDQ